MQHRARNKREARKTAMAVAACVLDSSSDAWEIDTKFANDKEFERFIAEWRRLIQELDRRSL